MRVKDMKASSEILTASEFEDSITRLKSSRATPMSGVGAMFAIG